MLKLPFKTAPQGFEKIIVGSPSIGELEIPKMGDLSPNERLYIEQQMKDYPDMRQLAAKMSKDIAKTSGMKSAEVYKALTTSDYEKLSEHLEKFVEFEDNYLQIIRHRALSMATAILKFRVAQEWEIENSKDENQIHFLLIKALAEFAQKEESGWETSETSELTEEDLGKSQKKELAPTGTKSIGELTTTGQETKDLVLSNSVPSPPF